ncbi:hypothetical protein STIUS_v1c03390 [Spiroplasma sp. TIUS-1]|uniref:dual specificity protein phosphatase family protein n=1 Tax=Spiroplasma sp. TIUS-1 TaxID=216963 RepID=UPI0013995F86|nr:dual specificity protein phosphatase [Spiroplasma sp. TIUS-1]QHX35893.1 hypothetical protein STIUS_v1c03390 [Spiroplasma sp. TIUS-1]
MGMKKIIDNLYLGDRNSAPIDTELRISCAEELYKGPSGTLFNQTDSVTYINFEDYPYSLDKDLILKSLQEIENNIANKKIYVHCMWGINRSASLVFMFMVRNGYLKGDTYLSAQNEFHKIYPNHSPNPGWKSFLKNNFPYDF